MVNPAPIAKGILKAASLVSSIGKVSNEIPSAPSVLTNKYRWIECTVQNKTQFPIVFTDSYFDSGKFWTGPGNMSPFSDMTFSACNKDGSLWTGVSFGLSFEIKVPAVDGSTTTREFSIGLSNPNSGAEKQFVMWDRTAKNAYENLSTDASSHIYSPTYEGEDVDGNKVKFHIEITLTAGIQPTLSIIEVLDVA